jgi:hypothetical protein
VAFDGGKKRTTMRNGFSRKSVAEPPSARERGW